MESCHYNDDDNNSITMDDQNDDDSDTTKNKRWNINSDKSVNQYKEQLNRSSEKFDSTWRIEGRIQEQYNHWISILEAVLDRSCKVKKKRSLKCGATKDIRIKMKQLREKKKRRREQETRNTRQQRT